MDKKEKELSKFLSLILRHKPETIGINLDEKEADIEHERTMLKDQKRMLTSGDDRNFYKKKRKDCWRCLIEKD